jgi:multidrug efflux pump subunit AcrB
MSYNNTGLIGSQDGDIQIALKEGHKPTPGYVREMRERLPKRFPGVTFSFLPADITSQILNFGAPAPVDLQIRGPDLQADFSYASRLLRDIRSIPGIADVRIQQSRNSPTFHVDVDRTRAQYIGLTERDVTNAISVSLAGTTQVAPAFWLNPANGVQYPIAIQTPQYRIDSMGALEGMPITPANRAEPQVLGGVASIQRITTNAVFSFRNTTSNRLCRFTQPLKIATLARSRASCNRCLTGTRRTGLAACQRRSSVRCRR